jgi:hypothetical protein
MAFSSTYDTTAPGAAVSNREDLTDLLTLLEPTSTPCLSLAPKRKAKATTHEWTVDKLSDPDGTSGLIEGADVTAFEDKFDGLDRLKNYVQGFRRSAKVSQVQNAVDSVTTNFPKAQVKSLLEIKRDMEQSIVSDTDAAAGTTNTAAKSAGLGSWLQTDAPSSVTSNYWTPAAQIVSDLSEANLVAALASMFRVSGDMQNVTLVADTDVRDAISQFTRAEGTTGGVTYHVNQNASEKKVTLSVSFYESDYGMIKIVNSNPKCSADSANADRGHIIDFSKIGWAELLPLKQYVLENQGGGQRGYCECWGTLECLDPRAHGKIDLAQ